MHYLVATLRKKFESELSIKTVYRQAELEEAIVRKLLSSKSARSYRGIIELKKRMWVRLSYR